MPRLAMVLEPPDPKMSPRQMAQRDKLLVLGAIVILGLIIFGVMQLSHYRREVGRFRAAEARLREVPAFKDTHLRRVASRDLGDGASEMIGTTGHVIATVAQQAGGDLYVGFQTPGLEYKPLTAKELAPYLFSGDLLDPDATRFAAQAAGALLVLWPDLGREAIHYEKVEAVTLSAPKATVDVGLTLESGDRVGVSVSLDVVRHRMLAVDLRKR